MTSANLLLAAAIVFVSGTFLRADAASFSLAEGYVSGALTAHVDWVGSANAKFLVDPSGSGLVSNVGAVAWKNMSYVGGSQSTAKTNYTVSALFTVEGTDSSTQPGDKALYSVMFVDGSNRLHLLFRRLAGGDFDVGFFEDSGFVNAAANGTNVSPADLGLDEAWSPTDRLRLSLTIVRGEDETDWFYSGSLENIDTSETLSTVSGLFESSIDFFTNSITGGMSSRSEAAEADLSPLTIHEFNVEGLGSDELNTWMPPAGTASNDTFSVSVRHSGDAAWTDLFVYDVLTGHQSVAPTNSSMVCFDFSGTVDVKVDYNPATVSSYEIRPLSYDVNAVHNGQVIIFCLTQDPDSPRKLVVRVNESWDTEVLHILTNPPETNEPASNDSNVYVIDPGDEVPNVLPEGKGTYYFKPGVHTLPKGLWLDVDLQTVHSIDRVVLNQGRFDGLNLANRFRVETKEQADGTYSVAYDGTANSSTGTVSFSFAPVDARYVRLTLLGNNTPGSYYFASVLNEFEIYEGENPSNLALNNAVAGGMPSYPQAVDGSSWTKYRSATVYGNMHVGESFFIGQDDVMVYIAPGAVVNGAVLSDSVNNLTIRGRGILTGRNLDHAVYGGHPEGKSGLVRLVAGTDNRVEGITLLDSPGWAIVMNDSIRPVVRNINFIGSNVNADGIHMTGCTSGLVSGVFLRAPDDLLVMYHYAAGSRNTFRNSVLWNDDARVVLLGLAGTGTQPISNITFRNLDILNQRGVWQPDKYNGCFSLWPTGGNRISDILFENIRIDPHEKPDTSTVFFFQCNEWRSGDGGGSLRNITLSDVTYHGSGEKASLLRGYSPERNIDGVYFYNYSRQETLITNAASGNIDVTDYVTNVYYHATNQPPTIALTVPANYTAPASVALSANPADTDGFISRVDFYNKDQLIGSVYDPPWSMVWSPVPAGIYPLHAVAVDNAGAAVPSAVKTIEVAPVPATVGFTAAEGYVEGKLTDHIGWNGLASSGFRVDPSGSGAVTHVGAAAWEEVQYMGDVQSASGATYTVEALFSFEGNDISSQTVIKGLFSVDFPDGIAGIHLIFRRLTGGDFDIGFFENSGTVNTSGNGAGVSPAMLGLDPAGSISDRLRLSLTITRGDDEADWTYRGRLENVDTDTVLSSVSGAFESSFSFFTNNVIAGMKSNSAAAEADISPFTIHEFSVNSTSALSRAMIGSIEKAGTGCLKLAVRSKGDWEELRLMGTTNLVHGVWAPVAHSDDGIGTFMKTNLLYSTVLDSTQRVIYVHINNPVSFFQVKQENE
jgi:hypothetical protein